VNNNSNLVNQQLLKANTTAANTAAQKEQIHVSREVDGLNDTGIVGELLTNGTQNLSDANKYFAMSKFNATGLLDQNNQLIPSKAQLTENPNNPNDGSVLCGDSMYVAGDPGVGGKGNNYKDIPVDVQPGYYTMFKDGAADGQNITVNSHVETINPEGNKAFTEYGFVVQDGNGAKTQATLSGGVLNITNANGQTQKLLPGQTYTVGDPSDPTAKFYYATAPGAGENGSDEQRLMVDYYEKPTADTIKQLVAQGMSQSDAEKMRTKTTLSYGFRTPDGTDTYGSSEGVGSGTQLKTCANGVKTYYDSNYEEGPCTLQDISTCGCPPPPPPPPCPTAPNEHARIWGDPHIEDADGGKYNFQEKGLFNVLKDKGVALNAQMVAGPDNTTVMSQAGLTVGGRTVTVQPGGKITVGYADSSITTPPVTLADGQTMMLDNGYSITRKGNIATVDSTNGEYKMQFDTSPSYKGFKYVDIDVWTKGGGVLSDGQAPTGLVGETFDADKTKQTKIKNSVDSYKVSSLLNKTTSSTTTTSTTGSTTTTGSTGTTTTTNEDTTGTTDTGEPNTDPTTTTGSTTGTTTTGTTGTTTTTGNTTTTSPPTPPAWTGDISTYLPQVITWLMQLLGMQKS
jgi:hypothetical protein